MISYFASQYCVLELVNSFDFVLQQVSELLDHVTSVLPEPIQFPSAPRDNLGSVQIPLAAKNKKGKLPAWSRKKRRMHASLATQWQTALEAGKACGLEVVPA